MTIMNLNIIQCNSLIVLDIFVFTYQIILKFDNITHHLMHVSNHNAALKVLANHNAVVVELHINFVTNQPLGVVITFERFLSTLTSSRW